ncbi:hypothetical protein HN873_057509, partial [Arachis hypogaea]
MGRRTGRDFSSRARSERRGGRQREASFRSRGEQGFHNGEEALMPMSNMVTTQGCDAGKLIGGEIHRWSWKRRMVVDILPLKMLSTVRQRSDQSRSSLQRQATRKVFKSIKEDSNLRSGFSSSFSSYFKMRTPMDMINKINLEKETLSLKRCKIQVIVRRPVILSEGQ